MVEEAYSDRENIKFYRNEKNLGLAASRNRGLEQARGSYIAYLDDDDIWLPEKIKTQLAFLEANDEYVACTSHHIESISKKVIGSSVSHIKLNDIVCFNFIGPPSKLLVRSNINIKFDENAVHAEDWDYYIRLLQIGPVYMHKQPLIIYDTIHFGRMTTGFSKLTIEQIKYKANMTYKNRELIGESNFRERMSEYYFSGIFQRNGKFRFIVEVYRDIGAKPILKVFFNKLNRAFTR
jgi:glycosyltransferase involved in cell wall biosynthesis